MNSSKQDDDGLLPAYEPSPEIQQSSVVHHHYHHHHHHDQGPATSQIGYGAIETETEPQRWATARGVQSEHDEELGDVHSSVADGCSRVIRTIVTILFFVAFFTVLVNTLKLAFDHHGLHEPHPEPWPRPGGLEPHHPDRRTIEEQTRDILSTTPLIDGHNDLAILIRDRYKNDISSKQFKNEFENGPMPLNVDLPRLRKGMVGGAFWSAFVVCPVNASYDMTDSNYATAASHTLEQIDLLRRLQAQYPESFTSPTIQGEGNSGRGSMLRRWHANKSYFGPISIEGLHQVLPSAPMSMLREYYALGVRMATLTWNCHNAFADAAIVMNSFTGPAKVINGISRPKEGAVTKRGRDVIREMNRLGMIVDISHTSYWTQKEVLSTEDNRISRAPVVFSHSSAYSLCPHPRNVRDEILDLVPQSKSLVMVNFSPDFVSCKAAVNGTEGSKPHFALPDFYEKNSTLHQVARHIEYIGTRIGYEYVGIGSDFDGMGKEAPKGIDGVDKFPDLVAELLRMGISERHVRAVVGGNLLRVWEEVDRVSVQMREEGVQPGLDDGSGY